MSYNISDWRTIELKDFVLPANIESITYVDPITAKFSCGEGFCKGILNESYLSVIAIGCWGEGSGTYFHFMLKEIFPHSSGRLAAWLTWEGGDDITILIVQDGQVYYASVDMTDLISVVDHHLKTMQNAPHLSLLSKE
jgi:hypothetical protein